MRKTSKRVLIKASRLILYEFQMFFHVFRLYSDFLSKENLNHGGVKNVIENNIFLENFLMHARILYEFFYLPGKNKDDILAKHFLMEGAYERFKNSELKRFIYR